MTIIYITIIIYITMTIIYITIIIYITMTIIYPPLNLAGLTLNT